MRHSCLCVYRKSRLLPSRDVQRHLSARYRTADDVGRLRSNADRTVYWWRLQHRLCDGRAAILRPPVHGATQLWRRRQESRRFTSMSARLYVLPGGFLPLRSRYDYRSVDLSMSPTSSLKIPPYPHRNKKVSVLSLVCPSPLTIRPNNIQYQSLWLYSINHCFILLCFILLLLYIFSHLFSLMATIF